MNKCDFAVISELHFVFGRGYELHGSQIAYGYAKCQPTAGRLKEAEVMADRRMYEKKKAMKQNNAEKENRIAGSVT